MDFTTYIKPELAIVVAMLYVVGLILKSIGAINNKYIPAILGALGISICFLYGMSNEGLNATTVFNALTQGVLTAGTAVYVNQLIKQSKK